MVIFRESNEMKTIQTQEQSEELKNVVEKITDELRSSGLFKGSLSIERVVPSPTAPKTTPAGFAHLIVQEEVQKKVLGLISQKVKNILFIVKEGFYDIDEKGRKDIFVFLKSKTVESIVKKHLDEYGRKNSAETVYKA